VTCCTHPDDGQAPGFCQRGADLFRSRSIQNRGKWVASYEPGRRIVSISLPQSRWQRWQRMSEAAEQRAARMMLPFVVWRVKGHHGPGSNAAMKPRAPAGSTKVRAISG